MSFIVGYLWFCLASGTLTFLYFVLDDLYCLYLNQKNKISKRSYYFVDKQWEVFLFTMLFMIPIVNIFWIPVWLGMTFKPFNFIIKWLKTH